MDQEFTPEQLETIWYIVAGLLAIPAFFLVRFFFYLILPRGILKMFHKDRGYGKKNKKSLQKEKKFYED